MQKGDKKVKKLVILVFCAICLLTSCTNDPYSNKRPFDYGEATWVCKEADIRFFIDLEKEDYYYPEGYLQLDDNKYLCKFYFIHQTNQVSISIYPLEYINIPDTERDRNSIVAELDGECEFSKECLVIKVDTASDTIFNGEFEKLTFYRT